MTAEIKIPDGYYRVAYAERQAGDLFLCVYDIKCSSFGWEPVPDSENSLPSMFVIRKEIQ